MSIWTASSVNGPFDAAGLQVGELLLMRSDGKYVATLRDIFLGGAKIDGGFDMTRRAGRRKP